MLDTKKNGNFPGTHEKEDGVRSKKDGWQPYLYLTIYLTNLNALVSIFAPALFSIVYRRIISFNRRIGIFPKLHALSL